MPQASERHVFHFMVKDIQYCLDIENIERVMLLMALQTVPGGPADLAGLMNLHGHSVPVLDIAIRAGLQPDQSYDSDTPLLICVHQEKRVGLIVTEVIGVEVADSMNLAVRSGVESTTLPVAGIINTPRGLSLMLDIKRLMALDGLSDAPNAA